MIGRDQMFAPIFDPFDRTAQPQRRDADENIFGIKLAAHAEAAADVALMELDGGGIAGEPAREAVAIPMGHFRCAVKLEDAAHLSRDRASGFQRHAAVAANREIERDDGVRRGKSLRDVAVAFVHARHFGRMAGVELARRCVRTKHDRQFVDVDGHEVSGIFGSIGVRGEHHRDRLADITHAVFGEDRLAIGIESFYAREAEIDRWDVGNVCRRPDRGNARHVACRTRIDREDAAMCERGTNHPHVQLMRERNVAREAARTGDERPIFETRNRTADEGHCGYADLCTGVIT